MTSKRDGVSVAGPTSLTEQMCSRKCMCANEIKFVLEKNCPGQWLFVRWWHFVQWSH